MDNKQIAHDLAVAYISANPADTPKATAAKYFEVYQELLAEVKTAKSERPKPTINPKILNRL